MIKNLAYTIVLVRDPEKMKRFYTETLGFKVKFEAYPNWVELANAGSTVALNLADEQTRFRLNSEANSVELCFGVDRIHDLCAELKSKGVVFIKEASHDEQWKFTLAQFVDPEGNRVNLFEPDIKAEPARKVAKARPKLKKSAKKKPVATKTKSKARRRRR